MALWEKLKIQKYDEAWKPDQEEEYEDSKGNVVNKKTFEDLKRQGLLWKKIAPPLKKTPHFHLPTTIWVKIIQYARTFIVILIF